MNMKVVGFLHNALYGGTRERRTRTMDRESRPFRAKVFLFLALLFTGLSGRAALQFDVFPGYDGIIPEGSWFPIICEIKNDGGPFTGVIEVNPGNYNQGQTRRAIVELPTGTLKRLTIPVFSTSRGYATWDVRLLDERGKVRGEQTGVRARKQAAPSTTLIGALSRNAGGTPILEAIKNQQAELQPSSARMLPSIFPDNPLVLEGMDTLYLNSEKAADLKDNQVEALLAWVHAGGHLIVAVEQIGDVTASGWLKTILPAEVNDVRTLKSHFAFQKWLQEPWPGATVSGQMRRGGGNRGVMMSDAEARQPFARLADDSKFELAEMQVVKGKVRDGKVMLSEDDEPLIVTANRGLGRATVLLFSPEREPFRSWKHLPIFWARLAEVPGAYYSANSSAYYQGGFSTDGIFGALLDTKQVHKLPVEWLLVLLIVYLVVIGPLDQFWLRKIGRPMLTWITFPCYVVLFSLLIYFIGYKLRAGESEWNELHLVDVLVHGERAQLRGRTYASVYSPANMRYLLDGQQKYSTLRGEYVGAWGGQSTERATILQNGDSFKAEIFVPVWTSQLFVNDWWQPSSIPLDVTVTAQGENYQVNAVNKTDKKLTNAKLVIDGQIISIGEVGPGSTRTVSVGKGQGTSLHDFVNMQGQNFQNVVQSRQRAFGASESGRLEDVPSTTLAVSFLSYMQNRNEYMNNFVSSPGLDMSSSMEHGEAILFAYAEDYSPVKSMYQFKPKRSHRGTMFRFAIPVIKQS